MVERPALGRAPRFQLGSGGQVRAPCPFALFIADDFKSRIAVSFLGDPKLGRGDGFRQMQQLRVAAEVEKHAHLPGLRLLGHLEDKGAVSGMAAHDGDEDHPVRGEVTLMQRERRGSRPGRIGPGWFLFHKAADTVRTLPGRQLLGEACRWLGGVGSGWGRNDTLSVSSVSLHDVGDSVLADGQITGDPPVASTFDD